MRQRKFQVIGYWWYFKKLVTHKCRVFVECCKLGIPLQGILHDLDKFKPHVFRELATLSCHGMLIEGSLPHARYATATALHHFRSKHHWQYWWGNNGRYEEMPIKYRKEFLADLRAWSRWGGGNKEWHREYFAIKRVDNRFGPVTLLWFERELKLPKHQDVQLDEQWERDDVPRSLKELEGPTGEICSLCGVRTCTL